MPCPNSPASDAFALRVPFHSSSVANLTVTTVAEANDEYTPAATGPHKGLLS